MPSPPEAARGAAKRAAAGLLLAAVAAVSAAATAAMPSDVAAPTKPGRESVRAAVTELRRDPNLGTRRTIRRLNWVDSKSPPPADTPPWIVEFFQFLGQGMRALLWAGGAVLFAIAAIWGYRLFKRRVPPAGEVRPAPATHVGSLDIRPESLPDDVGAAALALLEAGRAREALSLLYRGSLSRAVHRHNVPIAASFTEGEALAAVRRGLETPRADYVRQLVDLRRQAVYAGRSLESVTVADLCRQFAPAFGGAGT